MDTEQAIEVYSSVLPLYFLEYFYTIIALAWEFATFSDVKVCVIVRKTVLDVSSNILQLIHTLEQGNTLILL